MIVFFALQIADIISTLIFLSKGVGEANPLVRFFMQSFSPILGLILIKVIALGFGLIWNRRGRNFLWVNIVFTVLVMWNVIAIFVSTGI